MYRWKSTRFDIHDNSTVYESACGIGLNLYMTLEILAEAKGLKNLVIYGNEFVPESVEVANSMLASLELPSGGQMGKICPADSAHLHDFVPADAFDLVYTGYISPLIDPLNFNLSKNSATFGKYTELCESKDEQKQEQNKLAQTRQEDWYAQWVGEMIRIARPGAPVIVEQVSYPQCEAYFDWGGVGKDFWKQAVEKYNWDIDPKSIDMEDDTIFRRRYHVFMRKNGKKASRS